MVSFTTTFLEHTHAGAASCRSLLHAVWCDKEPTRSVDDDQASGWNLAWHATPLRHRLHHVQQVTAGELFETQAVAYAAHRPDYPPELFAAVFAYADHHGTAARDLAVDVATGSGQAATALARRFTRVVGTDAQRAQLALAPPVPNCSWLEAPAEALPVAGASADLVTVAQALHWFVDLPRFYAEAARVLKPRGTLACWGYGLSSFAPTAARAGSPTEAESARRATEAFLKTYRGLGQHWDERRALVECEYAGMEPGPPLFCEVVARRGDDALPMRKTLTIDQVVGYVRSWSAYAEYQKATGLAAGAEGDVAELLRAELCGAYGVGEVADAAVFEVDVVWPVFLMLATKSGCSNSSGTDRGGGSSR